MNSLVEQRRKTQDAFVDAAYALLAERGRDAVTVAALCDRVGVTKGSFYHHFGDMPGFVATFADRWQSYFVNLFADFAAEPDLRRRLQAMSNGSLVSMTPGVQAVFAWAGTNPTIAAAVHAVDRSVVALSDDTLVALAESEDGGRVVSAMNLSMIRGVLDRPRSFSGEHFLVRSARFFQTIGIEGGLLQVDGRLHLKVDSWRTMKPVASSPDLSWPLAPTARRTAVATWTQLGAASGTRERYFGAAGEVLAEKGSDGLTVAALVGRLDLTKGSFHHHFGTLPGFVQQWATEWERLELNRVDTLLAERNPVRRLELFLANLLLEPPAVEVSWRTWAHTNPIVGAAVDRVDQSRERLLDLTLNQILGGTDQRLAAHMTLGFVLGLHRWQPPLDSTLAARCAIEWMHRMLGIGAEIRGDSGFPSLALSA